MGKVKRCHLHTTPLSKSLKYFKLRLFLLQNKAIKNIPDHIPVSQDY